jgi:glutaredoxin
MDCALLHFCATASHSFASMSGWGKFTLGDGEHKDITIYGSNWCPHCHKEMSLLANSGATFVDCADPMNTAECKAKNVRAFPTVFKGEKHVEGEASLDELLKL